MSMWNILAAGKYSRMPSISFRRNTRRYIGPHNSLKHFVALLYLALDQAFVEHGEDKIRNSQED